MFSGGRARDVKVIRIWIFVQVKGAGGITHRAHVK